MSIENVSNESHYTTGYARLEGSLYDLNFVKLLTELDDTDKAVVTLFANLDYLYRICDSFKQSSKFFNQIKDYYFIFNAYRIKQKKRYTGIEIYRLSTAIQKGTMSSDYSYYWGLSYIYKSNKQKYIQIPLNLIDKLYAIYFKAADKYMKLFEAIGRARDTRAVVKNFWFKFEPPKELFKCKSKCYTADELIKLFRFASNKHLIIKTNLWKLPCPLVFTKKLQEEFEITCNSDETKIYKGGCEYSTGIFDGAI